MAVNAPAHGAAILAGELVVQVATPAEIVKLRLNQGVHRGIRLVAVEAQSLSRIVDEVVVAVHAIYRAMIDVSEGDVENGSLRSELRLPQRPCIAAGSGHRGQEGEGQQASHAASFRPAKANETAHMIMPHSSG